MAITKKDIASPKDIIAYFVSKLNNWINVAGVEDLGNNQWKILTCNTKWAQKGFTIPNIGEIIDVDFNNYITVESETEILVENFELYPVRFVHGTVIQVNIENFKSENGLDPKLRLPVIYLREFTEYTEQTKYSNSLIRIEIPLTLYFLTHCNLDEWKTSDAYNEAIYPMKNLADEFQKVLYKEKANVGEFKERNLNFHPKFGVRYVKKHASDSKGVEVNYFDDNLTGVECAINLPLKIDFCNTCKDFVPPIPIESISLFVNENLFKIYTTSPANLAIRNSLNQYVGSLDPDNGLVLVADSTITNDPTSPTYTQAVKATENLVLPPQNILINTVNEGLINSVGDIEIVTNTPPTSIDLTGRKVTLDFPPSEFDVNLVDRFGNDLGTKKVSANANWDLRTLTPFDFADIFISRLTNPPTGAQLTALTTFVNDMISAGLWQGATKIDFYLGSNVDDCSLNARYPFFTKSSQKSRFLGSPTYNSQGVVLNGSNCILTGVQPCNVNTELRQVSFYNNIDVVAASTQDLITTIGTNPEWKLRILGTGNQRIGFDSLNQNSVGGVLPYNGLVSLGRMDVAAVTEAVRCRVDNVLNGWTGAAKGADPLGEVVIGATVSTAYGVSTGTPLQVGYLRIGEYLNDTQEGIHSTLVNTLMTALGR